MAKRITDENLNVNMTINGGDKAQKALGDLQHSYRDLTKEQEDLRKAKQKLIAEGKKQTDAYKEIENELKKVKVQMSENKDEQASYRKEIGLASLSVNELVKRQRTLKSQMNSVSPKTEDWNKWNKELQETDKRLKEVRDEMKSTETVMGDAGNLAEQLGGAFGDIFQGIQSGNMQMVAAGFAVIKTNIAAAAKAGLAFVTTPFGATLAALAGIGLIAKQWWDYNVAVSKTIKLTEQLTEFSGERLSKYRAAVQATAETFDKDFNEVLRSSNSLAKQMKISQEEALDLINQGFIRGADSGGEFLDKLKEYPVQFKNAGYTAQDFIDIATQEAKGGIYSDKLVDAIKEADLALKEMTTTQQDALKNAFGEKYATELAEGLESGTITTKQALESIIEKSNEMGLNLQQQQQLVADVFKGAGEDAGGFAEIILQINQAFDEENKQLNENEIATKRFADANIEAEQAMADLFDASKSGFPAMLTNMKAATAEIKTGILEGLKSVFTSLKQLEAQAALEGQSEAVKEIVANTKEFGTTTVEEAEIQMDATAKNIERLKKTIDNLGFFESETPYKEELAKQEAYFKELKLIAKGESEELNKYLEILKSANQSNDDGKLTEAEKEALAAAAAAKREAYAKQEDQLTELILGKMKDREIAQMSGIDRELAQIDEKYRREIEKAEGHADRIAELEALKDQEKEDAKARRKKEYLDRAAEIEEENRLLKEEAEMEREVAAATTQQEKDELRLEHARQIALRELEMMKEAELAKVESVEGSEELIFAIKEKYRLQAAKLNREFDKGEENLRKDQVKWTEMTEQQKANAVTGSLSLVADAFNQGSDAWKAAKIAETIIATTQSAQNAYKFMASFGGPVLGAIGAAAATAAGMKKIQQIRQTEVQKIPKPGKKKVKGFEDGLYSDVTRTDGKRFRARNMGRTRTQIVTQPSYFQDDYLAGEAGPELIVDNATFRKLDPTVVQHIMDVRHNVRGFETGKYPASLPQAAQVPQTDPEMKMMLSMLINRLSEPIKAETKWGYDEVEKSKQLESEINRSNQNGNLTS